MEDPFQGLVVGGSDWQRINSLLLCGNEGNGKSQVLNQSWDYWAATTRFRPFIFASYKASSAFFIN